MEKTKTNEKKNGAKPLWERPKEPKKYTKAEMNRIKATQAVLEIIEKQKAAGDFDEYLEYLNEARAKT